MTAWTLLDGACLAAADDRRLDRRRTVACAGRRAVELARKYLLPSADTLGVPLGNWAAVLFEQGRIEEGSGLFDEALNLLRKANKAWELCDALSLRLVLKGRNRDAALVQGYVDAVYAAVSETRQPNEQRMRDQVLARLRAAVDDRQLAQLHRDGARLTEDAALRIGAPDGQ